MGKHICHIWVLENEVVPYNGMIKYKISYWTEEQGQDNAIDIQMSMYALAVDFMYQDLVFSDFTLTISNSVDSIWMI